MALNLVRAHSFKRTSGLWQISLRASSAGPSPSSPPKEGSLMFKYEKFLSQWPKILSLHRMVMDGSRWCFSDVKSYFSVKSDLYKGVRKIDQLTVPELEVQVQMMTEGPKMAVVCILLPLPLTVYIIGAAIIFFPRLVLTRHFWSDEQRFEYFHREVYDSQFRTLPGLITLYKKPQDVPQKFEDLDINVQFSLLRLHGIYPIPFLGMKRLLKRMEFLKELDKQIRPKINSLTERQLIFNLYIRRLDFSLLTADQMRETLRKWVEFSSNLSNVQYLFAPVHFKQPAFGDKMM
ncbi:hypothetical protein WR25_13648 [Diploscapter pachys]|uniref:Letm1 RBD domain-containing protein n=1 Tax=Diploscapter pachys TaxID=2018661 RepID=A0A2A2KRF3_9BILA|nr:hypothetical protein WR25_13648 [Diploscapter pachys]